MKFECIVELRGGYKPVLSVEKENEVRFVIETESRVAAGRMLSAMLKDSPNIKEWDYICIE